MRKNKAFGGKAKENSPSKYALGKDRAKAMRNSMRTIAVRTLMVVYFSLATPEYWGPNSLAL